MIIRKKFLPYFKPSIGNEEITEVVNTLKSGWITTGEKSHLFEQKFAENLKADSALGLNSCTAALHLALCLLNIKTGDEVITTPFTFVASTNVIEHIGAIPVFVDIELDTLNIDPEKIKEKITSKTKAILIVHYGGHACEMNKIMAIADFHNIPVIEDAAHGLGGSYYEKKLGTFGSFAAFSFYANKNITTIEGGMLIGPKEAIEKARIMSLHGINRNAWKRYRGDGNWHYEVVYPGLKYNMTDISASIGLCQLAKLPDFQKKRKIIAECYNYAFQNCNAFNIPTQRDGVLHSWYNYPLRLNLNNLKIGRDEFIEELKKYNIGTSVQFIPVHMHPFYKNKYNFLDEDYPISYSEYLKLICLPIYPLMTDKDVQYVIQSTHEITNKYKTQ